VLQSRSEDRGRSWSKLRPIRNAGSARPRLLVLEGAVLLSGGRFDAAVAQGIAPAPHQPNISDIRCADRSFRREECGGLS